MIVVSGLINLETTLRIDKFPLQYNAVNYPFGGVRSTVSGVGYNIAKALTALGEQVPFISIIGRDAVGELILNRAQADHLDSRFLLRLIDESPQSVIIYDHTGRRQIHVDLKNIQETPYPLVHFERVAATCDTAVLCNINFSRPFLESARALGKCIATDVHEISSLDDPYNHDFMAAADILFMSNGGLPMPEADWIKAVYQRFGNAVIVIGMGAKGALLSEQGVLQQVPAVQVRPIVNTIGAGDALFSAFVHLHTRRGYPPLAALQRAVVFAGYKIGARGAAEGFLDEAALEAEFTKIS